MNLYHVRNSYLQVYDESVEVELEFYDIEGLEALGPVDIVSQTVIIVNNAY